MIDDVDISRIRGGGSEGRVGGSSEEAQGRFMEKLPELLGGEHWKRTVLGRGSWQDKD